MKNTQESPGHQDDKILFLQNIEPFQSLDVAVLEGAAAAMTWLELPARTRIISQGAPGTDFYVIRSGLAKVFLEEGCKNTILAFLGEGDCFGEMSLLSGEPTNASVETVEPTVCLVQGASDFTHMAHSDPAFQQFFSQLFGRRMKTVYRELLTEKPGVSQVEPFLFRKTVGDMLSPGQQFCLPWETVRASAQKMVEKGIRTVIVVDDSSNPVGLFSLDSIVRAVLVEGRDPATRIEEVMEREFRHLDVNEYFFNALYEMIVSGTDTLMVMEKGKALGLLTGYDLLRFRGREVLFLARNIDSASDFDQLHTATVEVAGVLRTLMADGALASQACHVVSELNDRIVRQIIRLVEEACGDPPCPYAWLALGSEGRREQALLTDQDNAIVFVDGSPKSVRYFTEFSQAVVEALSSCGFPACRGDVMATSPQYFGSLTQWMVRIENWIRDAASSDRHALNIFVFLDFRLSAGDPWLERELRSHTIEAVKRNPLFLQALGRFVVDAPVPLGFFKDFVVEETGTYRDRVDLKADGLVPLLTCVKLLAWQKGVYETNTLRRIKALEALGSLSDELGDFLEQAFETLLTLKLRANLNDLEQGRLPGNDIDPASLSVREKQLLREAFLAVWHLEKAARRELGVEGSS